MEDDILSILILIIQINLNKIYAPIKSPLMEKIPFLSMEVDTKIICRISGTGIELKNSFWTP